MSCFVVAECEGALRPRRLLLCGHRSGAAQMWDLTAPIDKAAKPTQPVAANGGTGTYVSSYKLIDNFFISNVKTVIINILVNQEIAKRLSGLYF